MPTRRKHLWAAAVGLALLPACGPAGPDSGVSGDCTAKLAFEGTIYTFRHEAATSPPTAGDLDGRADVLDCDGTAVDTAVPVRIDGVPVEIAVAVVEEWPGVYVAEGSDATSWPDVLRRGSQ